MEPRRHDARERVRALARASLARGDALGWFEEAYRAAAGDPANVPWADPAGHPLLVEWLATRPDALSGKRALVIGCGLGEDAEELSRSGALVSAFDLSPTAIEWCRRLWPASRVDYRASDLFAAPSEWRRSFELVLEIYTLQALPPELRPAASSAMADFVAPGGELLAISRAREPDEPLGDVPWPLTRRELDDLTRAGLALEQLDDVPGVGDPPTRHWRALLRRACQSASAR